MKINFPRHIIYSIIFAISLIIFAVWFSTAKLIPMGKEYRKNKIELKKQRADLKRYEDYHDETLKMYNETRSKNRHIIEAFDTKFDIEQFKKDNKKYFINLAVTKSDKFKKEDWYEIYDVNTTSKIKSPVNFYDFLDALNKSKWIIGITFPINFTKDGELIHSNFKMKVYKKKSSDINSTTDK